MDPQHKMPAHLSDARPHLRPLLRGRWHLEMPRLQAQIEDASFDGHLASMPFSHDAVVLLGYDTPDRVWQVGPSELAAWNISFQEGLKIAVQNLCIVTSPSFHAMKSGAMVGDWPDGYDASRILLPEVIRECGIAGELVMMVPSRRAGILVAPLSSLEAQRWMIDCSRQLIEEHGGLISTAMFRYQDRRVTTYQPADAQLARRLSELQLVAASALYAEQKDLLKALHAKQGKDVFVASYQVAQRPGLSASACSWTQGITSLLPKTDLISMVVLDPSGADRHQVKVLDWDTMAAIAGDRLLPVDTYPPRFLVTAFPPADALARAPAVRL